MKAKYFLKCLGAGILFLAAILATGYVFMWLWNSIMPVVFALKTITYCQAFGLLIMGKIIFGWGRSKWSHGCCNCGTRNSWRGRWDEKWSKMTPEEKEKIKRGFGARCRDFGEEKKTE